MKETRTVVTVLGADHPGIVAQIAQMLADNDANIVDIRQNVLDKVFSMTMLVTLDEDRHGFNEVQDALIQAAEKLNVQAKIQREDVLNFMYNV